MTLSSRRASLDSTQARRRTTSRVASGVPFTDVLWLLRDEIAIGLAWAVLGMLLLLFFERESRRHATLELA